jgi:hypothetical protein
LPEQIPPEWFEVEGVNDTSGFALTNTSGVATFSYTGTSAGMDTIRAYFDTNGDGDYDIGEPTTDTVTKYYLDNFVTGGGNIKGVKTTTWSFAGTVGNLEYGSVGQFQIVDHRAKQAEAWHCNNNFSGLVFSDVNGSDPGAETPTASNDTATFWGTFTSNRGSPDLTLMIVIFDNQEPGKGFDTIDVDWWDGDSWEDWFDANIDGGNFQVHDIE